MTTARLLTLAWSPDPSVIGGSLALLVAYLAWMRGRLNARSLLFFLGIAVLGIALLSPIDRLGELYLFSVHMVQHMLLLLVVPPLLLWGLPPDETRRLLQHRSVRALEQVVGRPSVALPVMVVTLLAWHLPVFYTAALVNDRIHALEHLMFLVTATMFWWPVLKPVARDRLAPPNAMMYLFGAMASISILGMVLTFAPVPLYPFYVHPPDPYGALPLIRNGWGMSVLTDQQMGGVLMWIVGGIAFILSILTEFGLWFSGPDVDEPAASPRFDPPGHPQLQSARALPSEATDGDALLWKAVARSRSELALGESQHSRPPSPRHDGRNAVTALEGAG